MAMTTSAIRLEPEEKEWITSFASLNGNSFSAQVREWLLERLEDELDSMALLDAIKESDKNNEKPIPFAKVKNRWL